ncbi:MAG: DNA repair protein RecO [Gammaproteobacteria bacterium]
MKVAPHPCFILHQRPYRESSLLLDVFSRDYGRVSLIAKGAKRQKSKVTGLLQIYQRLSMAWQGKNDLMTLISVESDADICLLSNRGLIAGFYLNELIMRLLHHHESHLDLFMAYDKALEELVNVDLEQAVLRKFEKKLLQSLGYGLILDHDVQSGDAINKDGEYYYQADYGPMFAKPSRSDYIRISGKTLIALNGECITTAEALRESKHLMRYVLSRHLGGKPLASRKLFQAYVENAQPV